MTQKNKNIILILSVLLACFVCYKFAISKTIEQKEKYLVLKQQDEFYKNYPKQLSILRQKETYYDSILNKLQINNLSIQSNLLQKITQFSDENNLKVTDFKEPHKTTNNNLTINTYDFSVKGDFNSINELIYQLEQQTKFGELTHVQFLKKKNYKTNRYFLEARVLLKSFE